MCSVFRSIAWLSLPRFDQCGLAPRLPSCRSWPVDVHSDPRQWFGGSIFALRWKLRHSWRRSSIEGGSSLLLSRPLEREAAPRTRQPPWPLKMKSSASLRRWTRWCRRRTRWGQSGRREKCPLAPSRARLKLLSDQSAALHLSGAPAFFRRGGINKGLMEGRLRSHAVPLLWCSSCHMWQAQLW